MTISPKEPRFPGERPEHIDNPHLVRDGRHDSEHRELSDGRHIDEAGWMLELVCSWSTTARAAALLVVLAAIITTMSLLSVDVTIGPIRIGH